MKSQVVERHQKVLSAKPKNDELHLHPAAASEGGVGKQNVCGVVISVVVCTYVCVCMSCRRNRKPSRQAAMGKQTKEVIPEMSPDRLHRLGSASCACPRNFICIFS